MTDDTTQVFWQIASKFYPDCTLQRVRNLSGGVSAQMTALELDTHTVVVRQHGLADRTRNPKIARDEFNLLAQLQSAGLPVPTPYHLDTSCEILRTPYLIIELVNGKTVFEPTDVDDYLRQFAAMLARIHQVDLSSVDVSSLRKQNPLDIACRAPALVHGDYWMGNVLWRDGELIAVVDWEDAAIGDPLADLGNARLEVLWALGKDAMHTFTTHYRAAMPHLEYGILPQWDLQLAQKVAGQFTAWAADEAAAKTMLERHEWFIQQATSQLK